MGFIPGGIKQIRLIVSPATCFVKSQITLLVATTKGKLLLIFLLVVLYVVLIGLFPHPDKPTIKPKMVVFNKYVDSFFADIIDCN